MSSCLFFVKAKDINKTDLTDVSSQNNIQPMLINTNNTWHIRGNPVVEFPLCYQLWQCRSQLAEKYESSKRISILPVGTWGLCENYLTSDEITEDPYNKECIKCDAPPPDLSCL